MDVHHNKYSVCTAVDANTPPSLYQFIQNKLFLNYKYEKLMPFREVTGASCESHMKCIKALLRKNAEFHIVTEVVCSTFNGYNGGTQLYIPYLQQYSNMKCQVSSALQPSSL
jgi:hypothetical protein